MRWIPGPPSRRRAWVASAYALLLAGCFFPARRTGEIGPVRPAGVPPPEASASGTRMVLVTSAALEERRNVLWSATSQLAWDALAKALGPLGGLRLGPPAPADVVAELGRRPFPTADLDPASFVVEAGFAGDGVADRFRTRLAGMGGASFPLPLPALDPDDAVAFAYLRKDLPFRHPFHVHAKRLAFAGGAPRVVAFGLDPDARGADVGRIAGQALFHGAPADESPGAASAAFALELVPGDEAERIVLGAIERPATLEDAWTRVRGLLDRPGEPLSGRVELSVPKVDFAATRVFDEILGAPLVGLPPGSFVKDARQRIEFTLSEEGARFVAAASMAASCSAAPLPRVVRFDRPFLLALVRKGAGRPYFLAWFGNDDLFVKG